MNTKEKENFILCLNRGRWEEGKMAQMCILAIFPSPLISLHSKISLIFYNSHHKLVFFFFFFQNKLIVISIIWQCHDEYRIWRTYPNNERIEKELRENGGLIDIFSCLVEQKSGRKHRDVYFLFDLTIFNLSNMGGK